MRQIKFRGKRIDNGEWVYGCLILSTKDAWIVTDDSSIYEGIQISHLRIDNISKVHRKTVGQFTGLTDKNGREVWEHDKVIDSNGELWIVAFYENSFCLVTKLMPEVEMINEVMLMHLIDWTELEVIGNIHEGGNR